MSSLDSVYFKATKDNIIVMMDSNVCFDDIARSLEIKVRQARKFFGDSIAVIAFKGRELSDSEEAALLSIISRETDLKISAVAVVGDEPVDLPPKKTDKIVHIDQIAKHVNANPGPFESLADTYSSNKANTVFHKGTLRSGMSIEHEGSIVILGDVNPGGVITAGGNAIVLGTLKGTVIAGAYGDYDSYVAFISLQATSIRSTQIRIADIGTNFAGGSFKGKEVGPSRVYVQNGKMFIDPLS